MLDVRERDSLVDVADDTKRFILARRARFVAAALAGLSVASCDSCDSKSATSSDASATPPNGTSEPTMPRVCLSPARRLPPLDASPDPEPPLDPPVDAAPPPAGNVDVTTTVTGTLANAERIVRAGFQPRARACYRAALRTDPKAFGRIVVTLTVSPAGDVQSAKIASDAGAAKVVSECVTQAAKNLRFDESEKGAVVTIDATFTLPK